MVIHAEVNLEFGCVLLDFFNAVFLASLEWLPEKTGYEYPIFINRECL